MDLSISRPTRAADAYMPIWAPLLAFNEQTVGDAAGEPFALTITKPGEAEVLGGLALLVVPEAARGRGIGRELMAQAEAEAQTRTCRAMWLDTYAFQARGFYEALGFRVFGQIDGPTPVFPRYFMQKSLTGH